MSGKRGRSGRPRKPSTLVNEGLERVDQRLPELFEKLIDRALEGDKDCLIYLIDRRLGRPHQSIDQRIKGQVELTADAYLAALRQVRAEIAETGVLQITGGEDG